MKQLLLSGLCLLLITSACAQEDCSLGLSYYQDIAISFPAGSGPQEAATYAIPFYSKALYEAGKIQADAGDLRITDMDCNPIPFYTQGLDTRDTNTVYLALPALEEAGMSIRLHYGSTELMSSVVDGQSVFIFFDDFDDDVIDEIAWEAVGQYSTYEESGGSLRYQGTYTAGSSVFKYVCPSEGYTEAVTFDFTAKVNNLGFYGIADIEDLERVGFRYGSGFSVDSLDVLAQLHDTINGGFGPISYPNIIVAADELNIISVSADIDENAHLRLNRFQNHSNQQSNLDTTVVEAYEFSAIRPFLTANWSPTEMEYLGIRHTPPVLPMTASFAEVANPVSSVSSYASRIFKLSPNPCSDLLQIRYSSDLVQGKELHIIDAQGRLVRSVVFERYLNVSMLEQGIYTLVIYLETGQPAMQRFQVFR